jgi:ankyrin repeat protein
MQSDSAAKTIPLGTAILRRAVETGDHALFEDIARRGLLKQVGREALNTIFTGSMACNPGIAKALVTAGADPKAKGAGGSALHALWADYDGACTGKNGANRIEMVRTLVALGVPVDGRSSSGKTPLMACSDPEFAKILLKAGANPNARDNDGTTPLLAVDDDRVAIILLRAGADPKARHADETVRQHATKAHWPATLAWLDAHGIK